MSKKRIFIIISALIIILAVISFFLLRGNSSPKDLSQIEEDGVLRIVTDYNSVGYYVSGDTIAGFNYDLIQLLKSHIPFEIEILLESSLDKSIEGLKKGKYDVMARNIPVTSELRASLRFTESVAQNRQVLIQRKKEYNDGLEPLRSHLNLAKKTLYRSEEHTSELQSPK
jgi:membrane-bound lytic murein transglycosylase MltF